MLLPLAKVALRIPGAAVRRQKCEVQRGKKKGGGLAVQLSEKLGDIDFFPEASSISRYTPTSFVTSGRVLHFKRLASHLAADTRDLQRRDVRSCALLDQGCDGIPTIRCAIL